MPLTGWVRSYPPRMLVGQVDEAAKQAKEAARQAVQVRCRERKSLASRQVAEKCKQVEEDREHSILCTETAENSGF